jgi:hypothetical protein
VDTASLQIAAAVAGDTASYPVVAVVAEGTDKGVGGMVSHRVAATAPTEEVAQDRAVMNPRAVQDKAVMNPKVAQDRAGMAA